MMDNERGPMILAACLFLFLLLWIVGGCIYEIVRFIAWWRIAFG